MKLIKKAVSTAKGASSLLFAAINAFNPLSYNSITQKPLASSIFYLLYFIAVLTLATLALSLPSLMSDLSDVSIAAQVSTKSVVVPKIPLLGNDAIIVNSTLGLTASEKYDVAVSNNEIRAKPLYCLVWKAACQAIGTRQEKLPLKLSGDSGIFLMLIVPSLIILSYLVALAKYASLALAAGIICYLILKLTRRSPALKDVLKITIYAATIPALLEIIFSFLNISLAISSILSIAAYVTIVAVASILSGQTEQSKNGIL